MVKRSPINAAKNRANVWFSKYIRLRDALETTGTMTEVECITCGKRIPIGKADCSHFIPGRTSGVLYREDNANALCITCNRFRSGAWPMHEKYIETKYGPELVARLKALYGYNPGMEEQEYRDIAKHYREAYNDLKNKAN